MEGFEERLLRGNTVASTRLSAYWQGKLLCHNNDEIVKEKKMLKIRLSIRHNACNYSKLEL